MSRERVVAGPPGVTTMDQQDAPPKPTYKSYRKKYRKMKLQFEEKMRESNSLFREEQKATELARRLQEQNDQLLEMLLDLNDSSKLPSHLSYDLDDHLLSPTATPKATVSEPPAEESEQTKDANGDAEHKDGKVSPPKLRVCTGNDDLANGELKSIKADISKLLTIPHTTLSSVLDDSDLLPSDINGSFPPGYLTSGHEEDYLFHLDKSLGITPATLPPRSASIADVDGGLDDYSSHPSHQHQLNRDIAAARNPVSVYNWLRKHQPQVFLQDNEMLPPEKGAEARGSVAGGTSSAAPGASTSTPVAGSSRSNTSRSAARRANAASARAEQDMMDEDSAIYGDYGNSFTPSASRGKRKRDDEAYRPKGAGGNRPAKRKRDDSDRASRKPRKSSLSGTRPGMAQA